MGGLFRAPKPVIVPPAATPDPAPALPTPEQAGEAVRAGARDRARRGLEGTIATSARGVLEALPAAPRKSLLGE